MTYEYLCSACGHDWEADQRISEPALEDCPACGKKTARRMVSGGAGFILKGGGWYADGYASKGEASKSATAQPAASKSESSKSTAASTAKSADSGGSKPESKKGDTANKSAAA